jgi:hypothetical protein
MKTIRALLVFAGTIIAAAFVSGQTVTEFYVVKLYDLTQTSNSGSTAGATPYGFFAQVGGSGLSGTYTVTTPGGSVGSPITLTGSATEREFEEAFAYADITALNNAYNNGNFSMALPNLNGVPQSVSNLSLTGDAFPNTFSITGGTWSGGKLMVDPTQDFTISFGNFTGFAAGDSIQLNIDPNYSQTSATAVNSFLVSGGSIPLAPGNTTGAEIAFIKLTDSDSSIAGASGVVGYVTIVSFDIQAIPEPSTYAAIFGALALAGVMIHRRRRLA